MTHTKSYTYTHTHTHTHTLNIRSRFLHHAPSAPHYQMNIVNSSDKWKISAMTVTGRVILVPVILPAQDVGHLAPIFLPLPLDSVNDSRHEVIFVLDDLAAALAVRVVSEAKDVAVVGQDESVSAAGSHGHGLGLRAVADGQSNTARLDKHFQRVSAPDSVIS